MDATSKSEYRRLSIQAPEVLYDRLVKAEAENAALADRLTACEAERDEAKQMFSSACQDAEFAEGQRDAMREDLAQARAERDKWSTEAQRMLAERDKITAENARLKKALRQIGEFATAHHLEQERDSHIWLHALIVDIPSMVDAALEKEQPWHLL